MLRDDAGRDDGLGRPDFDRCRSPSQHDFERTGANDGAAIVSAAPADAPAGANDALPADQEKYQLTAAPRRGQT